MRILSSVMFLLPDHYSLLIIVTPTGIEFKDFILGFRQCTFLIYYIKMY